MAGAGRPRRVPTRIRRLLWLLLVGLLAGCSPLPVASPSPVPSPGASGPVRPSTPTGAASPSPTQPPAPTAGAGDAWSLAGFGEEAAATQIRSVTDVADGFVSVGSAGRAAEVAMAWHSADGRAWEAETITGRGTSPASLVRWGDRVIALGGGQSARCAHPGELDVWVRDPDGTWTEAPFDRLFCAGGNPSLVIFGDRPWLVGDGSGDVPILMSSNDGLTWADRSDRIGDDFLWEAAVDRKGLWVVARSLATDDWLVLHSRDGTSWTTEPLRPAGVRISDVIAASVVDDGLVLLASTGRGIVRLAPAEAGGWDVRAVTGLPGPDLTSVAVVGGGLVAIAARDDGTNDLWASTDGIAWRPVARPAQAGSGSTLLDVAVRDDLAVLVGQVEAPDGTGAIGAVWTAPATILEP